MDPARATEQDVAAWSLAAGAKLLSINQALGHASVETTQVYPKTVDKVRENPIKYLEELVGDRAGGQYGPRCHVDDIGLPHWSGWGYHRRHC